MGLVAARSFVSVNRQNTWAVRELVEPSHMRLPHRRVFGKSPSAKEGGIIFREMIAACATRQKINGRISSRRENPDGRIICVLGMPVQRCARKLLNLVAITPMATQ
jgi:hypothetical protein